MRAAVAMRGAEGAVVSVEGFVRVETALCGRLDGTLAAEGIFEFM